MEFIVVIASIVSVATNYIIFKRISKLPFHTYNVYVPAPEQIEQKPIEQEVTVHQETPVSPTVKDESQYAWSNRSNIPIGPSRPAPPVVPTPEPSGPLERPAGFYR